MWEAVERGQADPILASVRGEDVRALFDEPLPREGTDVDAVVEAWTDTMLPLCRHNGHPRFFDAFAHQARAGGALRVAEH